jgi:hypothetical protein
MHAVLHPLAFSIGVLDRIRLAWLRLLGPLARPLVRDREKRIALAGTVSLAVALALCATAPLVLLAVSPLVLGVPHVASDLRYLLVRPGLHKRWAFLAVLVVCLAGLSIFVDPRLGFLPVALVPFLARGGTIGRRLFVFAAGAGLVALAWIESRPTALFFAHAHNFVAFGIFWAWRRDRRTWLHFVPMAVFALGCALILGGALEPMLAATGGLDRSWDGTDVYWQRALYAPFADEPWGTRFVLLFGFAQAAHYGIWLRLLPEEDRPRETPRTFSASFAALRADWGRIGTWIAVLVTLTLAVWAVVDLFAARMGYLRLVLFHGYFELAALAMLFCEGRPLRSEASVHGRSSQPPRVSLPAPQAA